MSTPKKDWSLTCLLIAQAQVVFNDNAAKFMLMGLAPQILSSDHAGKVISSLAILLVLPFVVLAPTAGWISDRYAKSVTLNRALMFQVFAMGWLIVALYFHSIIGAVVGFLLLSLQACIFSPAKQGILKELVPSSQLGVAVGWMEMLSILAILSGTICGGLSFDRWTKSSGDPWTGALLTALMLGGGALVALAIFQGVRRTEPQSAQVFRTSLIWEHFAQLKEIFQEKPLRLSSLGVAYFFSFGGILYMILVQLGIDLHGGQVGAVSESCKLLAIVAGGFATGSLVAAAFCRGRIELGLVPVGGLGLTLGVLILGLSVTKSMPFYAGLLVLGCSGGLFTVPLTAFLQDRAGNERRGRILAGMNLLVNIGSILAVAIQYGLGNWAHFSPSTQFLFLVVPSFLVAAYVVFLLPESLLWLGVLLATRLVYRIRIKGVENIPSGGVLLISNHVSYIDAVILQAACPRPIRFIVYEDFHKKWWVGWALKILNVIPISPSHARDAIRTTAQVLKAGEVVCVFPEGELTRTGNLQGLRKGFELMARQGEVPVVPVFLDSLWGSLFSFSQGRYFWKRPQRFPYPAFVHFGKPIAADKVNAVVARQALLNLGEESFEQRDELKGNLAYACLRSLSRKPWKPFIVDRFPERRELKRGMVLAIALALAKRWKTTIPQKRVGVVLPPGIGGVIANFALALSGKIPVNLNFTAGRAALDSCLRRAEIQTVISAEVLRKKLPDFPWPEQTLDVSKEIRVCGKAAIIPMLVAVWTIPACILARFLGIAMEGDREEAGLLFTSGSSGEPKGVILSHRNILGNCAQVAAADVLRRGDSLMGCLPLFHSFGFTVTLWYPLLYGVRLVTVPSPLEIKKIAEAVDEEKVTVMLGTPTFLRPYLKKAEPAQLQSLRLVIAGAEKLPADLAAAFKERFGAPIFEGYGLTETSPVASVNLPDPAITTSTAGTQSGNRAGSVGRLLPGMTARIVDPDSGAEKPLLDVGMLHLRGPNIFNGYLGDKERTDQVLKDGWFVTGDLARFDEDGFLFIAGRLSRFSKIGGEMVPHGTIEQKVIELFGFESAESQPVVVVGVPDESKGEALVVLTERELTPEALREKLSAAGLPNLWIPKIVRRVEKIPTLASGKLDLKGCENLAKAMSE